MALQLNPCPKETCNGFLFTDKTGLYNDPDNLTGYGEANDVTGPDDFDTYSLRVWQPKSDLTAPPLATLNLLPAPAPNDDYYFEWEFFAEDIGLKVIPSGVWYFEVEGVKDDITYSRSFYAIFTEQVNEKLSPALAKTDPTSPCKSGCESAYDLWMALKAVECDGVCDIEKAQRVIDYVNNNIKNCC